MQKTTLYLTDEIRRNLKEVARWTGRSEAQLVREALTLYLKRQERPVPRSIGAGEDSELTARDSKAWLKANWHPR
jgi:predicted transcriptional regulator